MKQKAGGMKPVYWEPQEAVMPTGKIVRVKVQEWDSTRHVGTAWIVGSGFGVVEVGYNDRFEPPLKVIRR